MTMKVCKKYVAQKSAQWYENNRDRQKQNARNLRIGYRQTAKEYVWAYLTNHPCISCGESDPHTLEFHHARGEKIIEVSRLIGRGHLWKT